MKGKVSVVKIDTDKYPNIASKYGIKVPLCPPQPVPISLFACLASYLTDSGSFKCKRTFH